MTGRVQRPRPVFCVIEHLYDRPEVAEQVCRGRFSHHGTTLDLGLEPEWLGAQLPVDPEWRLEWSKFYYGLDLAGAFRRTGERRFLEAWQTLVSSWIRDVPPDHDTTDVAGRRLQNWIYAWNGFAATPRFDGLDQPFGERLIASIAEQARFVRAHLTPERNHRTLEIYALFIVALALPQLDPEGELLQFAVAALDENVHSDIRDDGVQREGSSHYHMVVLRSLLGACENARRLGVALPQRYLDGVQRACEFAVHCHRPDGNIPALSDSDSGCYRDLIALAAALFGRDDWHWAASRGRVGKPPRTHASFPCAGYFIQRSGWGDGDRAFEDEAFLMFDAGPIGDGGHGHYDAMNVEVAANGRPLIVDPGRYVYSDAPPGWRRWFKTTAAHNTVTVDGLDQTPYRRGKPKGRVAVGRLRGREGAPGLDVMWGEAQSPCYEVLHRRRILFVANEYWLIEDHLAGERPHLYELRFHLSAEAWQRVEIGIAAPNGVAASQVVAPGLFLVTDGAQRTRIEDGWVSAQYGVKQPAPVVVFGSDGCSDATFVTLVRPSRADGPLPHLRVVRHGSGDRLVTVAEIADGQIVDRVAWTTSGCSLDLGDLGSAAAAWRRATADGERTGTASIATIDGRVPQPTCAEEE